MRRTDKIMAESSLMKYSLKCSAPPWWEFGKDGGPLWGDHQI